MNKEFVIFNTIKQQINKTYKQQHISPIHYSDVIMSAMSSQITDVSLVHSTACSEQRKHQSSASLAFVRETHRWPVDSRHKGPVTQKIFPFDDAILDLSNIRNNRANKTKCPSSYTTNLMAINKKMWNVVSRSFHYKISQRDECQCVLHMLSTVITQGFERETDTAEMTARWKENCVCINFAKFLFLIH